MNDHTHFANTSCYCYPCHKLQDGEELNCLTCFCPFYFTDCPIEGTPITIEVDGKKIKDCSSCSWIHDPKNYPVIMKHLTEKIYETPVH